MPPAEALDQVGAATLERMAAAPRYNRWMFDRLRRWVGRRVLEIGAGIGNMSAFLVDRERVVLTAELRLPAVSPGLLAERLDTVVCLNVLEHIEDDRASLRTMHQLLQPGGRVVLLVPSLRALYGTLDEALGHFRRYVPDELSDKLGAAGFHLRHLEYFNLAGVPGWWLAGRVLHRRLIPAGALRWYDALVPLFRLERLLPKRIGQSLIAIGEVPA